VRRVGHQHAIAPGEAQIGGQRRALVTALFLDDLDEKHLAALDHVLDLVAPAQVLAALAKLVGGRFVHRRAGGAGTGLVRFVDRLRLRFRSLLVTFVFVRILVRLGPFGFGVAKPLFLGGLLRFLLQERVAVGLGDLVIIGVDFAEGQEAVAVAAIIDERRLERRFYPGDLGEIDIPFELLVLFGFEVELLDPVTLDDRDPGFLRVARIDQHAHGH
jgi:hypothetical protein